MQTRLAVLPTIALILLLCAAIPANADFHPSFLPEYTIGEATHPITVDGVLDDVVWQNAAVISNFSEYDPGDQVEPPVKTEVMIAYDDKNIYVAFICYDDPATLRASFCERDNIFSDDYIIVGMDTFGDSANAYKFAVNPYGIQGDLYFSAASGEDGGYDFVFDSAAKIVDEGWIAELAIPFTSLHFPQVLEQEWKLYLKRNHPREVRRQYSWAAFDRDNSCEACQWGTLHGIKGVTGGKGIRLLPAFVANQAGSRGEDGEFVNGDIKGELSFSGSYDISSDMTAELTINPDFSQVESDATQIDVNSRYALYYNEKRPFFQEGSDLFSTWFSAVYTRSINDPSIAGKLTGRSGKTSYSFLTAQDEHSAIILPFEEFSETATIGKSYSNILRVRQELGNGSHLGVVATDRRYENKGSGSLVSLDSRVRLDGIHQIEVQAVKTFTDEPDDLSITADLRGGTLNDISFDGDKHTAAFDGEKFSGHGVYASFERMGSSWKYDFDYWDYSPTFRADNGYRTSNNSRMGGFWTEYKFRFDNNPVFQSFTPNISVNRTWNYDGQTKDDNIALSLSGNLQRAQASFHGRIDTGSELYRGTQLEDVWGTHMCLHSRPSNMIACGGSVNYGHKPYYQARENARQSDYSMWFDLKPIDRLLLEFSWNYSDSKHMNDEGLWYAGYTGRGKLSLQLTRELSTRVVVQYNSFSNKWEADPLLSYKLNPFSIFYLGSTRDYRLISPNGENPQVNADAWHLTSRQYFMKLQYLFQL